MQMEQCPLYASKGFGGGGGSSGGGGLRGGGQMRPRRRGGWCRGQQRWVMLPLSYWRCLAVGVQRGHMLSHARLNQEDGVLCWWRINLSVAVEEAEAKREFSTNCEKV